jgi:S1-C subfamily serine protease
MITIYLVVGVSGISFAIPIDRAMEIIEQLRQHKYVARPYVGIQMVQCGKEDLALLVPELKT